MATVLPPLAAGAGTFSTGPRLSASYPDLLSLKDSVPYHDDIHSKQSFVHSEYEGVPAPSIPSTAPSSPYAHSMGSRDSYFSTPSYSSLDPNEDFRYEDDDSGFPCFDNNTPQTTSDSPHQHSLRRLDNSSEESVTTVSPPSGLRKDDEGDVKDDHWVMHEPTRHVDFLSHEWSEQDIWSSWRYVNARERKKKHQPSAEIANGERLENAAWRTWTKAKYDLDTISPESLNWMKDCDVTWLYGPLHVDKKSEMFGNQSPPTGRLSTSSSFLHKKPILKKKSASTALLQRSLTEHNLLSRVGDIIRVQRSSPVPRRGGLRRDNSEFSLPSYHTSSVVNTPAEYSKQESLPRYSFGTETPSESKHVFFNEEVRQVQAIESEDDERDPPSPEDEFSESDEDDDGGLMMAPVRTKSNRSTPRSSFSDSNKTIAELPPTTLKYRKDTPEPPESQRVPIFVPGRALQHSSSQETLKPPNPNQNFLLDDDPELNDDPWQSNHGKGSDYSPYEPEDHDDPPGMRRTASGMFMPYDDNEDEAAINNTLFGQAMYAVNTFRDIAHVVWNVGWSRGS